MRRRQAGQIVRNFEIDSDVIRIGRLTDVEITLESATVSREHAVIRRSGDRYILEDSGSVNGVLVGGERVTSHTLSPGDSISIEDYVIVFEPSDDMFPSGGAERALRPLAEALGLSLERTAAGVVDIVNENMCGALRLVSVEQGHDPREFALVAFGGAGPMHANALGKLLQAWPVILRTNRNGTRASASRTK